MPREILRVTNVRSGQDSITSEKWSICPMCGPNSHIFFMSVFCDKGLDMWTARSLPAFLLKNESLLLGHHKYTFLKHKATKDNPLQRSSSMMRICSSFTFRTSLQDVHANGKRTSAVLILHQICFPIGGKNWTAQRKIMVFQNINVCHVKYTIESDFSFSNMKHERSSV